MDHPTDADPTQQPPPTRQATHGRLHPAPPPPVDRWINPPPAGAVDWNRLDRQ